MIKVRKVTAIVAVAMLTSYSLPQVASAGILYGELENLDGKYVYSAIKDTAAGTNLVNLKTMSMAGWRTPSKCMNYVFGLLGNCRDTDAFYKSHINFSDTFKGWAMTMGLMPVFTIFGMFGDKDVFDADAFAKASAEASANSGLNPQLAVEKYDSYVKTANQLEGQYVSSAKARFSSLYDKYSTNYSNFYNSLKIMSKLVDDSGFYRKEDLINDLNDQIKVTKNDVPRYTIVGNEYQKSFSCSPAEYFTTVDGLIASTKAQYDQDVKKLQADIRLYEEQLKASTAEVKIEHASTVKIGDYTVDVSAPERAQFSNDSSNDIPVRYTVKSKDFHRVFPRYSNEDSNIKVVSDGKELRIVNKTKGFVQVRTVSVYYNDDISNYTFSTPLELAPESTKMGLTLASICNEKVESLSEYPGQTAASAKKTHLGFGLAIKYSIVDRNVDKTLYSTSQYNLYKVLTAI